MNAVEKFREENRQYRTITIRVLNSMEGFQSASQLEKATMGARHGRPFFHEQNWFHLESYQPFSTGLSDMAKDWGIMLSWKNGVISGYRDGLRGDVLDYMSSLIGPCYRVRSEHPNKEDKAKVAGTRRRVRSAWAE
jgi:hypothetical protein